MLLTSASEPVRWKGFYEMPLTMKQIERERRDGRYLDADGLYLYIKGNSKIWILQFYKLEEDGKRRKHFMSLGPTHIYNLQQARKLANKHRAQVKAGENPKEIVQKERDANRAKWKYPNTNTKKPEPIKRIKICSKCNNTFAVKTKERFCESCKIETKREANQKAHQKRTIDNLALRAFRNLGLMENIYDRIKRS